MGVAKTSKKSATVKKPSKPSKPQKAPAKKVPAKAPAKAKVPAKKVPVKKAALVAKKIPAKNVKGAKKPLPKVVPKKPVKTLSPKELKALKAKEKAQKEKERQLLAKEKARLLKEKARQKEIERKEALKEKALLLKEKEREKKEKEKEKERLRKEKELLKAKEKAEKEAQKLAEKEAKEREKLKAKGLLKPAPEEKNAKGDVKKGRFEDDDDFEGLDGFGEDEDIDLSELEEEGGDRELRDLKKKIDDEIMSLNETFSLDDIKDAIASLEYFVDKRGDECVEKGCDNLKTTLNYCRLHYIKNWKSIQRKKEILREGRLQDYIRDLIEKYPLKYLESMLTDLSDDKEFFRVLNELNILANYTVEESEAAEDEVEADSEADITIDARDYTLARTAIDED